MTRRVLHLFSNHKVTGPAELALDSSRFVEEASRGSDGEPAWEGHFVCASHPSDPTWLSDLAREREARLLAVPGLRLPKHFHPLRAFADARRLRRALERERFDLLHCHLPNDHLIAAQARGRMPAARRPALVRTLYDGEVPPPTWRTRWTLGARCDRLICFSDAVRDRLLETVSGLVPERIERLHPPIDTERFRPATPDARARGRERLGIAPGAFTAGIVARMQRHRRFEHVLEAVRQVAAEVPGFRFVIIGRGTHQETVARGPVRDLGLSDVVVFSGYLQGQEYEDCLAALDAKLFLVPGSDGTCRAVREALAAGIPVVAARRGLLSELVRDRETGRVVEDRAENLARALTELAQHRDELDRLSRQARDHAETHFGYDRYASELLRIYEEVLVETGSTRS